MKTRIFLLILMAVAVFACQKDKEPGVARQEVTFEATLVQPGGGFKSSEAFECKDLTVDYALIKIDGSYFFVDVYTVAGVLYTQAIKLDIPGGGTKNFTVSEFYLMHQWGGKDPVPFDPADPTPDEIVWATPTEAGPYHEYVTDPVNVQFTLDAFHKMQVPIEVLCYEEADFDDFGFFWFDITEKIIRTQCFFGDLCLKHPADYNLSHYANQPTWPQIDVPAIINLIVKKKVGATWVEVEESPFTNDNEDANWGVGAPVCIEYADVVNQVDSFMVELQIMVKQGNGFPFVTFKTWKFKDDQMLVPPPPASDGVLDFVLGNCNITDPDLQLAPWQNLPERADVRIRYPGTIENTYWDVKFEAYYPAGNYDLPPVVTPWMGGFCGDKNHVIAPGLFNGYIYSSLRDNDWPPGMPFTLQQIARVNWLMNHSAEFGYPIGHYSGADGGEVQKAIWNLLNGYTYGGDAGVMSAAASTHGDFVPLPGGWAAVLIIKNNEPWNYQLIFVTVDP